MLKYFTILVGFLLAGCSHSDSSDSASPPPGTLDAYCQQDGNIISVEAPAGSSTRCVPPSSPNQP